MAHFVVAIAYNNGVIICEQYEKMNGKYFADFVRRNFDFMFSVCGKMIDKTFIQDGDPSQNSALARREWEKCGAMLLKIPPRSPDINPIENFFNIINEDLRSQAIENDITHETFQQFVDRVRNKMLNFPCKVINDIIDSMYKRMLLIKQNKGERLKY